MKSLYLLIDLASVSLPLLYTFHKRIRFYSELYAALPSIAIAAILFVVWDVYFTQIGVWGFNSRYTLGYSVFGLPIEEILFFFCIPYCCLFTYHVLKKYIPEPAIDERALPLLRIAGAILIGLSLLNAHALYTLSSFGLCGMAIIITSFTARPQLLHSAIVYIVILIPFLVVNGILTGSFIDEPVVWYSSQHMLGLRIFTIPIEDSAYGYLLFLLNVILFEALQSRRGHKRRSEISQY